MNGRYEILMTRYPISIRTEENLLIIEWLHLAPGVDPLASIAGVHWRDIPSNSFGMTYVSKSRGIDMTAILRLRPGITLDDFTYHII
jgi:hypothetical protein